MKKLRDILESAKRKVVKLNGERVCNQTSNRCGCCSGDYALISLKEKIEILKFMKLNSEIKEKILKNKLEESTCYFRDKKNGTCFIYDLRPICCRYISYKIYEKDDCYKTCSPFEPCRKGKSTVIRVEKNRVFTKEIPLKSFFLDDDEYYFIDDNVISEYQEYKKTQKLKLSSIIDEMKK